MGNGSSDSDRRNDYNIAFVRVENVVATGIKSNDRCRDACDECLGRYDAGFLTKFRLKPTRSLMPAVPFPAGKPLYR
jgi:hypothetical protein